jgi:hypothetical protein
MCRLTTATTNTTSASLLAVPAKAGVVVIQIQIQNYLHSIYPTTDVEIVMLAHLKTNSEQQIRFFTPKSCHLIYIGGPKSNEKYFFGRVRGVSSVYCRLVGVRDCPPH